VRLVINNFFLTIIIPALNEEKNITLAIEDTLSAFKEFNIKGEIVVVNDGSSDSTPILVRRKIEEFPDEIRMINHTKPQGIGASFWDGIDNAQGNVVCMIPGDNENDPREILQYFPLLEYVDIVIPFVFNKRIRSKLRNILSYIYQFIIDITFLLFLKYTNGTVLYRKSLLKELNTRCSGFFFQTDILVRLLKRRYLFAEVPYRLGLRKTGKSKAISLPSLFGVLLGYINLVKDIYFKNKNMLKDCGFAEDSVSKRRFRLS
jgi:dolichol-phosphate mannosyltransferase